MFKSDRRALGLTNFGAQQAFVAGATLYLRHTLQHANAAPMQVDGEGEGDDALKATALLGVLNGITTLTFAVGAVGFNPFS